MAGTRNLREGRDPERSRVVILIAAEELFAQRGFDGVSIAEIATAAGFSRGAPNYFFGSKEGLYREVLERVFVAREAATRQAFKPLVAWAESSDRGPLDRALTKAVSGYSEFLIQRPSFFKLIQREELAAAARLRDVSGESKAIEEGFASVRAVAEERGLAAFEVKDAVFVFVSLAFFPLSQQSTFMAALSRDLSQPRTRRRHVRLVVDQLLHLLRQGG
jgi:TetR/AcrR family transcriptional regulator